MARKINKNTYTGAIANHLLRKGKDNGKMHRSLIRLDSHHRHKNRILDVRFVHQGSEFQHGRLEIDVKSFGYDQYGFSTIGKQDLEPAEYEHFRIYQGILGYIDLPNRKELLKKQIFNESYRGWYIKLLEKTLKNLEEEEEADVKELENYRHPLMHRRKKVDPEDNKHLSQDIVRFLLKHGKRNNLGWRSCRRLSPPCHHEQELHVDYIYGRQRNPSTPSDPPTEGRLEISVNRPFKDQYAIGLTSGLSGKYGQFSIIPGDYSFRILKEGEVTSNLHEQYQERHHRFLEWTFDCLQLGEEMQVIRI